MMGVFTIVFTTLMPQDIPRFHVFVLCGLLAWNWCAGSVMGGVFSITGNAHLIKKVAFPREILPLASVISNGINFVLACIPLVAIAAFSGIVPSPLIVLLPLVIAIQFVFLGGVALILGSLNVYFRDTEAIADVAILAWFFLTPIFYSVENLSPQYSRLIYILNPMASIISTYRLIFYYQSPPAPEFVLRMALQAAIVFVVGYTFFSWRAPDFGEEV